MTVSMPHADWDDHAGWERYYAAIRDSGEYPESYDSGLRDGWSYAEPLKKAGWTKIWLPGCGISLLPHALARAGFRVWASDVSPTAIEMQNAMRSTPLPDNMMNSEASSDGGELHLLVHDFRQSLPETGFDVILNLRSFQGLVGDSLRSAACTHYDALRQGGYAFFSTINVQGPHRNRLEDALIEAGFHIPLNRSDRWFRAALDETGIPYVFILGAPMAFRGDDRYHGEDGQAKWDADTKLLRGFMAEYRTRREQEAEETKDIFQAGVARIAQVIYNTG